MVEDSSEKTGDIQKELVRVINIILEKKDVFQDTVENNSNKDIHDVNVNSIKNELKVITKILGSKINKQLPFDDDVNRVMKIISNFSDIVITPSIDYNENRITYPSFESLGNADEVIRILDKMTLPPFNFLVKEIDERFPICPLHPEFLGTILRSYCPNCSTLNTTQVHIFEHTACGNMIENNLPDIIPNINCPYCKKNIVDSEIRKKGRWHICNACGKRFDEHEIKLHCIGSNHDFEIETAKMIVVPRYKITIDRKSLNDYALALLRHLNEQLESNDKKTSKS